MLRYSKLTDAQVLAKVLHVCQQENVEYSEDGLEAVVFTAQVRHNLLIRGAVPGFKPVVFLG